MKPGERKKCEACGEEMIGATNTSTGNVAPILLAPRENGNCLVFQAETPEGPEPTEIRYAITDVHTREWCQRHGVPLRLNHFADCPEAQRFHRERRS